MKRKLGKVMLGGYQTTVPETVRRALRLGKRDRIRYTIRPDGDAILLRAAAGDSDDPARAPFLGALARDLAEQPERLKAVNADFVRRIQGLVGGVEFNLDAPLSEDDGRLFASCLRWPCLAQGGWPRQGRRQRLRAPTSDWAGNLRSRSRHG